MNKFFTVVILFLYTSVSVYANNSLQNALFAKIIYVKQNDTLNVRAKADFKSKKITELDHDMVVGLSGTCKKISKSTWCKVYELAAYGGNKEGWVNAYYLKPYSEGFVTVKGYEKNCQYALECANKEGKKQCLVILDLGKDAKWIERNLLRGESQFGAAPEDMDGYCMRGEWLETYLEKNKNHDKKIDQTDIKAVVNSVLESLDEKESVRQIATFIHPEQGVVITEMVRFGSKDDIHFSRVSFLDTLQGKKKLFWGHTYGKGDEIYKTLSEYLDELHREKKKVSKTVLLDSLKGFSEKNGELIKGVEVYWINESSKTKEYDYLGMVVILSEYRGKWYIVGLLRDRWTI